MSNTKNKKNRTINPRRFNRWFWGILCAPFVILTLLLLLIWAGAFGKLPTFEDLENPQNNLATEILSEDGQMMGSFFIQNRSYVDYNELSPYLVEALIATEDARFYSHSGIDFIGLARVAVKTVALGNRDQGGGSTISQQLAKNLYPRDTMNRSALSRTAMIGISKLKEWITAVMLEHNYTKEEIIAMYLNTVPYGSNAYGIKSAARTFFNKQPSELNIEESAMLVGVVNAPTKYSPRRNPENAAQRRNTVLKRMREKGYLKRAQLDSVMKNPIVLDYHPVSHNEGMATYFREMLRGIMTAKRPERSDFASEWDYKTALTQWENDPLYGWCNKNTKPDGSAYDLYRDGLKIYTTVNSTLQRYAEQAMWEHMSKDVQPTMDAQIKRTGRIFQKITDEERDRIINNAVRLSDRYRILKNSGMDETAINRAFDEPTEMRLFSYRGEVDTLLSPRDSVIYYKRMMRAGFMAMNPQTGAVKAYVGGPNFRYMKYDMVRQGRRQVGSTIKPFIYTFAIDHLGLNPCTPVPNLQVSIETDNGDAWQPREAGRVVYDGVLHPLWWGLALSRNNYSAWIMKQAKQPDAVADFIHKMGIHSYIDPVFALCLGTSDFSLYEMVGAYGTFANRGVFTEPMVVTRIEDRQGNVLAEFTPSTVDAVSEETAYTMITMMENVVNRGTAGRLRGMYGFRGRIAGKTGTSQGNSDAWFMGVTPQLVAGAWIGGEDRSIRFLSRGEGSAVAMPLFGIFMKKVYADRSLGITEDDTFTQPLGFKKFDCTTNSVSSEGEESKGSTEEDEFFN